MMDEKKSFVLSKAIMFPMDTDRQSSVWCKTKNHHRVAAVFIRLVYRRRPKNYFFCFLQVKTWAQVMTFPIIIICGVSYKSLPITSISDLMVMCDVPTLYQSCRNDGGSAEAEWSCFAGWQSPSFLDASMLQRASSGLARSTTEKLVFHFRSFHSYICCGVSCFNQLFILDIFAIFFRWPFCKWR